MTNPEIIALANMFQQWNLLKVTINPIFVHPAEIKLPIYRDPFCPTKYFIAEFEKDGQSELVEVHYDLFQDFADTFKPNLH